MPVIVIPDVIRTGFDFPGTQQWLGGDVEFLPLGTIVFLIALVVFRKGIIIKPKTN